MDARGLKSTGFPDTDRDILQKAFDEEFKNDLEAARERKRESKRRAAQQAGLQKRRMLMEQTLQEEQDELAKNHQVSLMIDLIKDNAANTSLRIDVNSVTARCLAKAFWSNSTITCLDLSSNDLNDHAGSYLARVLKRNNTLRKIELDNNKLGPKSAVAFGESLKTNKSIIFLSLDSNPLCVNDDIQSVKSLSEALKVNTTLVSLNLWRTGIGANTGNMFANALEENNVILFCDVGHNNINLCDVKRISQKLESNVNAYEKRERHRRDQELLDADKNAREKAEQDRQQKESDLVLWLQNRRDERAEMKRTSEEEKLLEMLAELEIKKKKEAEQRESERKAAEEAAAKKAAKKAKKK